MPGNFKENDLRVARTLDAIQEAFLKLLERRGFGQITVNAICEDARISRRTFYLHFNDKYDLLKACLTNSSTKFNLNADDNSRFICGNKKIISNLMKDANDETLELMHMFILSLLNIEETRGVDGKLSPRYIIISNFCTGGMMKLLSWQVDNKFPQELQLVLNTHTISLILHIMTWESDQNYNDRGEPPNERP